VACLIGHRHDQALPAEDDHLLVGGIGCPGGIRGRAGKKAVGIAAQAGGIGRAGVGRQQHVIDPAFWQQSLVVPQAIEI
jgi:hypothetical protein